METASGIPPPLLAIPFAIKALTLPEMFIQNATTRFICKDILINPFMTDRQTNQFCHSAYLLRAPLPLQRKLNKLNCTLGYRPLCRRNSSLLTQTLSTLRNITCCCTIAPEFTGNSRLTDPHPLPNLTTTTILFIKQGNRCPSVSCWYFMVTHSSLLGRGIAYQQLTPYSPRASA